MVLVIGLLTIGFATGFGSEASAEPTVQAFLLDWQQGRYAQAAALTNGSPAQVSAQLTAAYSDLDATNTFFAMGPVTQHGNTAVASFKATVDLAEGEHQWSYTGRFTLTQKNGQWRVDWAPSVINPGLGPGDRLAVLTSFAPRAQVQDAAGQPLVMKSVDYHVGVYPGRLANAARTAAEFSQIADLNEQQVLGQIHAAPPAQFLSLLTLDRASFGPMWSRLAKVPGLSYQRRSERLFDSLATEVVGQVGTEDSPALRAEGAAYQPGATMGVTGLQQAYQNTLAGTPSTAVIVVNAAGRTVATLWDPPAQPAAPVRTTIDGRDQAAAVAALAKEPNSGEIVAVNATNGDIVALASHEAGRVRLPPGGALNAKLEPGMAFSIVSAAALLGIYPANTPLPCNNVEVVGGQTFTYRPSSSPSATFAQDFAAGCGTAIASMSEKLTAPQLTAVERSFGIGAPWSLRPQAFSGSAQAASNEAGVAAQSVGTGGVRMSPLGMAMVAAEVDSGTGHAPVLIASDPAGTWKTALSASQLGELRQLMRVAVRSGIAHGANVAGRPQVFGQAGVVQTGKNAWLSWFVGYRGDMALSVIETGATQAQAAASLAGAFLSKLP